MFSFSTSLTSPLVTTKSLGISIETPTLSPFLRSS
nr:MAG TPA: hypothetical protein [Crassvirales sp.]